MPAWDTCVSLTVAFLHPPGGPWADRPSPDGCCRPPTLARPWQGEALQTLPGGTSQTGGHPARAAGLRGSLLLALLPSPFYEAQGDVSRHRPTPASLSPPLRPPQGVQHSGLTGPHARLSGLKSASSQPPAPAGPAQAGFLTPTCSPQAPQPRLPDPLSWRPVLPTPGNGLFKRRREGQRELSAFQTWARNTPTGTCA